MVDRLLRDVGGPRRIAASLCATIFMIVVTPQSHLLAAPGTPDPGFDGDGFGVGSPGGANWFSAVAVQADGKIVVAGTTGVVPLDFLIARFATDGSLDATFGTGGTVTLDIGDDYARDVLIQPDGRILVAGYTGDPDDAVAIRLLSSGAVDPSFGTSGIQQIVIPTTEERVASLALQADGKIILAGEQTATGSGRTFLARLLSDGSLDPTFGSSGIALHDHGGPEGIHDVGVQSDGKIVTAGRLDYDSAVQRYLTDGSLDATFGSSGTVNLGGFLLNGLALRTDDGIVVVGRDGHQIAVHQLLAPGALDPSFGGGSLWFPVPGGATVRRGNLIVRADGRVVIGVSVSSLSTGFDAVVLGLLPDGSIDPTFGGPTIPELGSDLGFYDVALAPDGTVALAGDAGLDSLVARYGTTFAVCADGFLEAPEICDDGNTVAGDCCAPDCTAEAVGMACASDGDPCTLDQCDTIGLCAHPPGNDGAACDDGDPCSGLDLCDGGSCLGSGIPDPGLCRGPATTPSKGLLRIKDDAVDTRDKLVWRWLRGEEFSGLPIQDYVFCLWDSSGLPQPLVHTEIDQTSCNGFPCWKPKGPTQFVYLDSRATHAGVRRLFPLAGADTKARVFFDAKGPDAAVPLLPLVPPVSAQLHAADGSCWAATYSVPKKNDARIFKASPD